MLILPDVAMREFLINNEYVDYFSLWSSQKPRDMDFRITRDGAIFNLYLKLGIFLKH